MCGIIVREARPYEAEAMGEYYNRWEEEKE